MRTTEAPRNEKAQMTAEERMKAQLEKQQSDRRNQEGSRRIEQREALKKGIPADKVERVKLVCPVSRGETVAER